MLEQRQRKEFAQGMANGRYLQKFEDEARIRELETKYRDAVDMLDIYSERFSMMCGDFAARVQRMADRPARREPGPVPASLQMPWSPLAEDQPSLLIPSSPELEALDSLRNESPLSPICLLSPQSECDTLLSEPPLPKPHTEQLSSQEFLYPESSDGSVEDLDTPSSLVYYAASPVTVPIPDVTPPPLPDQSQSAVDVHRPGVPVPCSSGLGESNEFSSVTSTAVSTPDESAVINVAGPFSRPTSTSSTLLSSLPLAGESGSASSFDEKKHASSLADLPELDFHDASLTALTAKEALFSPTSIRPSIPYTPTSLSELQTLMRQAHNGDNEALVAVKQFCTRAQSTSTKARSEIQRYVITHWRRPSVGSKKIPSPPPPVAPPLGSDIYVDASTTWGIGLVWGSKWLAWKLKDGWNVNGRDITWAELIAIEVGLLSAIASPSLPGCLVVKSDNQGVVRSITNKTSKSPIMQEVVSRILALVKKHGLKLEVKWIKTDENPADGPSRGDLPPTVNLLKTRPVLPAHLIQVLDGSVMIV